ncbi:hypothetical protein CAPTEDRAFT_222067 [Capitella teleta]|uniref:Biogenesis of lysosome-related organelles complex 1 subunit 7 n=1 Tax=Capitella teleta TaxID=283909 RepID=R7TCR5_CAPTE|nr:hypothetical protein CAPTEDRAFT_222067 [Capitella teleta]|eukprot:ELT91519.1 hypothetical protein CAPTEDRAFT_222067 [Capitella teleta]
MAEEIDHAARDALAEGLMGLLRPAVEEVDERVRTVRYLKRISENQQVPVELDAYVKKLNNARRRIMLANNILQNTQDRLGKLHYNVSKETAKRKALMEPPSPGPPS